MPKVRRAKRPTRIVYTKKHLSWWMILAILFKARLSRQSAIARRRLLVAFVIISDWHHDHRLLTLPSSYIVPPPTPSPWKLAVHLVLSLLLTAGVVGGAYAGYVLILKDLPAVTELRSKPQPLTTTIRDRNGNVLYRIYDEENRTLVPLSSISPHLIHATIAIEDQHFYEHWGFSVSGISRALQSNLHGEAVQGGSTITQQLVKNRLLTSERTIQRKVREMVLAILAEQSYSKEQILEMYLNSVAYGGPTYGVEAAANTYFGKSASELDLAESALLAGLTAAPSAYTPFGASPELARFRQAEVLRRMVEDGYVTSEEAQIAQNQPLSFRSDSTDIRAPHFVMYVRKLLADKYGEDLLQTGGFEVLTTLDLDLQNQTQQTVTDEVAKIQRLRISNGAALVTNPQTGEILSMIGSVNYFNFTNDGQVNVTLRPRQPGSSIKPLTYAMALEKGYTPASLIADTPITYTQAGSPPYSPKNYDGTFHGNVTLREALASSYNIPAVKLLASLGLPNYIDKAESMGITTWKDRSRFGLSLTLGGGEVLMTDLATLYGSFATGGYTVQLNPILEIRTTSGDVLYRNSCALDNVCERERTLSSTVAWQITDILKDNKARTPAFGSQSVLTIPNQEVAVKTGTTNNLHDNWTIGYTTDRLVAVWVGNNNNTAMSYVASGITGASPIWNLIIRSLLDTTHPHAFVPPTGMKKIAICADTGTLPCKGCPRISEEWYSPGTEPQKSCRTEQFVKPESLTLNSD